MKYCDFCSLYDLDVDSEIDPNAEVTVSDRITGVTHLNDKLEGFSPEEIYDAVYEDYAATQLQLETLWIRVQTFKRASVYDMHGNLRTYNLDYDERTVAVPPVEPPCTGGEHDWEWFGQVVDLTPAARNYVVRGPVYSERCRNCGMTHVIQTDVDEPFSFLPGYTREEYGPVQSHKGETDDGSGTTD